MGSSVASHGSSLLKLMLKFGNELRVDAIKASWMGECKDGSVNTVLQYQAQGPEFGSQAPM